MRRGRVALRSKQPSNAGTFSAFYAQFFIWYGSTGALMSCTHLTCPYNGLTGQVAVWHSDIVRVQIRVTETGANGEHELEIRCVVTESHKRLTAHAATRILRREFPQIPHLTASKSKVLGKGVFSASHSVEPSEKCHFHYIFRNYYITELSN